MKILAKNGIKFTDAEAIEIFKNHGFKVDQNQVFNRRKHR
jgi:trimethylamine:corrinoid methyltransferase-like protein